MNAITVSITVEKEHAISAAAAHIMTHTGHYAGVDFRANGEGNYTTFDVISCMTGEILGDAVEMGHTFAVHIEPQYGDAHCTLFVEVKYLEQPRYYYNLITGASLTVTPTEFADRMRCETIDRHGWLSFDTDSDRDCAVARLIRCNAKYEVSGADGTIEPDDEDDGQDIPHDAAWTDEDFEFNF